MTLMTDLKDRGENPAGAPYDCILEVDTENHQAVIVWTEALAFHSEQGGEWSRLVDANGWLTPDAETALQVRLAALGPIEANGSTVFIADASDDEPSITFEVSTNYAEGETYEAWLDRIGWPVIATLINVTDPGTFMSPYLFDASGLVEA